METSTLWQRTLGNTDKDPSVQRLVVSLRNARGQVAHLTGRIASALPGLTIHDVSHLDALWDVAGVIAGDKFPLNPLEAYVFGCAVLLHDAGLCFEAFAGGRAAARETVQWRDARQRLASSELVEDADIRKIKVAGEQTEAMGLGIGRNGRVWRVSQADIAHIEGRMAGPPQSRFHGPRQVGVDKKAHSANLGRAARDDVRLARSARSHRSGRPARRLLSPRTRPPLGRCPARRPSPLGAARQGPACPG